LATLAELGSVKYSHAPKKEGILAIFVVGVSAVYQG